MAVEPACRTPTVPSATEEMPATCAFGENRPETKSLTPETERLLFSQGQRHEEQDQRVGPGIKQARPL